MQKVLLIIKEALNVWKKSSMLFWGKSIFVVLFLISFLVVLLFDKKNERKKTYVGYVILVLMGIYNPITFFLCDKLFSGSLPYFARIYQLLMVPLIIAYAFTFILEKIKGVVKILLFLVFASIIILGGNYVYNENWIQKADNFTKLPDDVVVICDTLHGYKSNVCVAAPSELSKDIRQYDGTIIMPYGRKWYSTELMDLLDVDNIDVERTLEEAGENSCDFIIVKNNDSNLRGLEARGQSLFVETDNYLVFRLQDIPRRERELNEFHQIVEQRYIDKDGNLRIGLAGYAIIKYKYDSYGNKKQELYYNTDEKPLEMSQGHYGMAYEYDRRHYMTGMTYLDQYGKPIINADGYSRITFKYDECDNVIEEYYFDANNHPIRLEDGQYGKKMKYDDENRVCEVIYVDDLGKPIKTKKGYAIKTNEYDGFDNVVAEYYYDEEGRPVALSTGQHGYIATYNDFNKLASYTYIGVDGKPIILNNGYAIIHYSYNDLEDFKVEYYFDDEGSPIAIGGGQYGQRSYYNDKNQTIKIEYLDPDGNPMMLSVGYSGLIRKYDYLGNIIEEMYLDTEGHILTMPRGFSGVKKTYNDKKQVDTLTYLDDNRKPIAIDNGTITIKYKYDEKGREIEEKYYDENDNPLAVSSLEYGVRIEYNSDGKIYRKYYLDENDKLMMRLSAYAIIEDFYDENGYISEEYYYDTEERPIGIGPGQYGFKREVDRFGKEQSLTYVGKDKNPMEITSNGMTFSKMESVYNSDGKLIKKKYYNLKGELAGEEDVE